MAHCKSPQGAVYHPGCHLDGNAGKHDGPYLQDLQKTGRHDALEIIVGKHVALDLFDISVFEDRHQLNDRFDEGIVKKNSRKREHSDHQ